LLLKHEQAGLVVVTSGAVKLGKILAKRDNCGQDLSKSEAAFRGFNPLMEAWQDSFASIGLLVVALTLTGQTFTKKNIHKLKKQLDSTFSSQAVVANTHDGLNSSRFKYFADANNNDVVGERLAGLCTDTYVICTNVDGVIDKYGNIIRDFQSLEQLNDITFHKDEKSNGTGGMETKLWAAIRFSLAGGMAYIVNGRERDVLLKVHRGEKVGTRVYIQKGEKI